MIVLFCVFFAWIFIPHYLPKSVAMIVLFVVCILCWYLSSKHRCYLQKNKFANKDVGVVVYVYLITSLISAVILPLILLLLGKRSQTVTIAACFIAILQPTTYIAFLMVTDHEEYLKKRRVWLPLYFHIIPEVASIHVLCRYYQMGFRPVLWALFLISSLTLSLIGLFSYQIKLDNSKIKLLGLHCAAVAVLLTFTLNLQLDGATGRPVTYTASHVYKRKMVCELEDGHSFSYAGCPTPVGDSGTILVYDGWFNISYVLP